MHRTYGNFREHTPSSWPISRCGAFRWQRWLMTLPCNHSGPKIDPEHLMISTSSNCTCAPKAQGFQFYCMLSRATCCPQGHSVRRLVAVGVHPHARGDAER